MRIVLHLLSEMWNSRQACVTLHPAPCRAMLLYMNDTVLSRTGDAFLCACAPAGALLRRNAESRNAAAGGRGRHCGITAAVGESEEQRKPERFSGYRKAGRGRGVVNKPRPRLRLCYYYCMVLFSFAGSQTVQHLLGVSFYALYLEYRWCL